MDNKFREVYVQFAVLQSCSLEKQNARIVNRLRFAYLRILCSLDTAILQPWHRLCSLGKNKTLSVRTGRA